MIEESMKENSNEFKMTKEFVDKELDNGSLFMLEEHLDRLPDDWIDCLMFIRAHGMKSGNMHSLIIIDGAEEFEKLNNLTNKNSIELFIFPDNKKIVWNVLLIKHKNEESGENECIIGGGESLRKFCDKKNIYYKSLIDPKGNLLSSTNMKYQKKEGEDCRIPEKVM